MSSNPPNLSGPDASGVLPFVEVTQQKLGKIITRPALRSQLLQRPPFRFLQDIVKELHAATGCFGSTFQNGELSRKIEGAPDKAAFLEKVKSFVSVTSGSEFRIDIRKILAGQDAERTNELLQALADIATQTRSAPIPTAVTGSESLPRTKETGSTPKQTESSMPSTKSGNADPTNATLEANQADTTRIALSNTTSISKELQPAPLVDAMSHSSDAAQVSTIPAAQILASSAAPVPANPPNLSRASSLANDNAPTEKSVIEITQRKLGAIITRPTLRTQLLQRPPFRFLQDIVKELQATTGCFGNVFQRDDLTKKMEGAAEKSAFLEKLIAFVSTASGSEFIIDIKKVLAGLDYERTNELLQTLADVTTKHQAVAPAQASRVAPESELVSAVENPRPNTSPINEPTKAPAESFSKPSTTELGHRSVERVNAEAAAAPPPTKRNPSPVPFHSTSHVSPDEKQNPLKPPLKSHESTSVAGSAPPKVPNLVKTDSKMDVVEPISAPNGIILEGEHAKDEFDDQEEEDPDPNVGREVAADPGITEDDKKHGRLVRDIMKQQERAAAASDANEGQTVGMERPAGIKLGRIGGKERRSSYSQQMIDLLRENIQKVCQSVNPLGKCIDFVNEDLELMRLELENWKQEQVVQTARLEKEQKATSEYLQPLQTDLKKIEKHIAQSKEHIQKLRGSIIRNDDQLKAILEKTHT